MSKSKRPIPDWPAQVIRAQEVHQAPFGDAPSLAGLRPRGGGGQAGGPEGVVGIAGESNTLQSLQDCPVKGEDVGPGGCGEPAWHLDYQTLRVSYRPGAPVDDDWLLAEVALWTWGRADPGIFERAGGTPDFEERWVAPDGVEVCCRPRGQTGGDWDAQVMLRGQAFERLTFTDWQRLNRAILAQADVVDVGRLDDAWDAPGFSLAQFLEAAKSDNLRSRAHSASATSTDVFKGAGDPGTTVYVGKRGSKRLVRCYDKRGFVRLELECRGRQAAALFALLLDAGSEVEAEKIARGFLRDYLDCVDRAADSNVSRCPLLPWWASFVEGVAKVRSVIARASDRVQNWDGYIRRQAARSLARLEALHVRAGTSFEDWMMSVIREGRRRLTGADLVLLDVVEAEQQRDAEGGEVGFGRWAVMRHVLGASGPPAGVPI